jgi:hypothetical protein
MELGVLDSESNNFDAFMVDGAFGTIAMQETRKASLTGAPWQNLFTWVANMSKAEKDALAEKIRRACPEVYGRAD